MSLSIKNNLLLVFIHGFKGDDETFLDFPKRLQHVLQETISNIKIRSIVYPRYETRGELKEAVERFCLWLENEVLKLTGNVRVCLLGHSMGGILAADTILKYANQTVKTTCKPNIIGLFAYDTPFYGVHPDVFSKAALKRFNKVTQSVSSTLTLLTSAAGASAISNPGLGKRSLFGIALGVSVAAAATYYHKDKVSKGVEWLGSHLEYVGVLWNQDELSKRVENLLKVPDIVFQCYYTQIPPQDDELPKTFIELPPSHMMSYFSSIACTSEDEIDAHLEIFNPDVNPFYYDLGHVTSKYICEMIAKSDVFRLEAF
ncbi:5902_t:CDS:2 [Funneliformis geosporum]|uniref:8757_t:CDS:1 n=1 Tax=Funneliformis geosporum TaxID=1117311 RepID=A0A9W4SWP4_9GLOM|nr:8757_t:CDS:2 [Funneliformis geosporum]CAI2186890.1 5902_t:CDS:2 [Funneliformis geosporum]